MSEETVKMPDAASPSVSPAVKPELQEVDVVPASPANVVTNGYADEAEKPGETLPQEGSGLPEEMEMAEEDLAAYDEFDSNDGGDSLEDELPAELQFSE